MNKYQDFVLCQLAEDLEPDCEDYYLAEIEAKANDCDKYKQVLIEIREYIYKNSAIHRFKPKLSIDNDFEFKGNAEDILQIIEKGLGGNNDE